MVSLAQLWVPILLSSVLVFFASAIPNGIWWAHPWKSVFKYVVDGVIYALIVAAIFACWPK